MGNDVWSCDHFPGHNAKKLNNLFDAYINDLLDVYDRNEVIIVNIEIQAVFSCYLLLKQWLPSFDSIPIVYWEITGGSKYLPALSAPSLLCQSLVC